MRYNKSLFIFRRDLRLHDNTALYEAIYSSKIVIPCFIFDPVQVGPENRYRSPFALQFMFESLEDLNDDLVHKGGQLYCFEGGTQEVVEHLIKTLKVDAVFVNFDHTPFARARDEGLATLCKHYAIDFNGYHDVLLHTPGTVITGSRKPYIKFTPFYKSVRNLNIARPRALPKALYYKAPVKGALSGLHIKKLLQESRVHSSFRGGRSAALLLLKKLSVIAQNYEACHDIPDEDCTTHLSAHLKFTTCSPREVYDNLIDLPRGESLLRQLFWRDFFTQVGLAFPRVLGHAFSPKYDHIRWSYDQEKFDRWTEGITGFPLVDAGIRQLRETGWMHNRVRLVVASFLTKDLHIDWRWGERFFAQLLVDYDPLVNNGNWQWVAGTGCDAQPYFRVFNPWLQQKKFDPHGRYIKKWVPELRNATPRSIHNWAEHYEEHWSYSYPAPMVNHADAIKQMLIKTRESLKNRV